MVLETSALVALAMNEPEASFLRLALEVEEELVTSAASYLEASIALLRKKKDAIAFRDVDELLADLVVTVIDIDAEQAQIAREAYARFGKGLGHRAQLNFGDCFAYALAKKRNERLLFIGNDFIHTDVLRA